MTRRALTLFLASILAVGLAIAGSTTRVPYVALKPGPAFNTLGSVGGTSVLTISGNTKPLNQTSGALDLVTVSVEDHITLFEAIAGWLSPSDAVLPREIVYPPTQTTQQAAQQDTQEMTQSQDDATTAALDELGYKATAKVTELPSDSPSRGKLRSGDVLTSINGKTYRTYLQLKALITAVGIGKVATVGYLRDGKAGTTAITTYATSDDKTAPKLGVDLNVTYPITVKIQLKDVGGPSAGMMFALGIIDKLGPASITGGKDIAGTGEIDALGNVTPIGGIAQKMRGAKAMGATVFLSPADNCAEAKKTKPSGITLVKVTSLTSALAALKDLAHAPSC